MLRTENSHQYTLTTKKSPETTKIFTAALHLKPTYVCTRMYYGTPYGTVPVQTTVHAYVMPVLVDIRGQLPQESIDSVLVGPKNSP